MQRHRDSTWQGHSQAGAEPVTGEPGNEVRARRAGGRMARGPADASTPTHLYSARRSTGGLAHGGGGIQASSARIACLFMPRPPDSLQETWLGRTSAEALSSPTLPCPTPGVTRALPDSVAPALRPDWRAGEGRGCPPGPRGPAPPASQVAPCETLPEYPWRDFLGAPGRDEGP